MQEILVKPSSIEISEYELGSSARLEYNFTIWNPIYHTKVYKGLDYDPDRKILYLPRGIDIDYVERTFRTKAYTRRPSPYKVNKESTMIRYLPRDDKQKEALRFLIGEGSYRYTRDKSQLKVNLNTGEGKTYVAIAYIAYMNIKSMIIMGTINLMDQWFNKILEYTDIEPAEIYMISGSASIRSLLRKSKEAVSKYKIILASHDTIKSFGDSNGWDKIKQLFDHLSIGIKVFDEAHKNFDNMLKIDFNSEVYKTIYLTATPHRSDDQEDIIYQLAFKNVPAIDLFDEELDPHTRYMAIHFNSRPTPQQIQKCRNQYGFNRIEYIKYVTQRPEFYNLIRILMPTIRKTCGKVLIYIGLNDSILLVYDWLIRNYPDMANDIGIFTSINPDKSEALNKNIILSTTKSCGDAMDIPRLKLTICLAEPFKTKVLARQTLGRTRDSDTTYIDIVDDGFYYTKKYYSEKKPIFAKYATECIDVRNSQYDIDAKARENEMKYNKLIKPIIMVNSDEEKEIVEPIIFKNPGE